MVAGGRDDARGEEIARWDIMRRPHFAAAARRSTSTALGEERLLDLAFHGERDGGRDAIPYRNPLALVAAWTTAVREARAAIEWLAGQPEVDAERIGAIGYSLGGFLTLMTASEEPLVRAVALAAAGDLPDTTPYVALVRRAVDPLRAVRKLDGRPLLLVNGRRDTTTRPALAERLFAYADEPKELRWY